MSFWTGGFLICVAGQEPVQAVGKGLPILFAQGWRAAGVDAAGAEGIHEIPHAQAGVDVLGGVEFAAGVQGMGTPFDDPGGQGDVAGYDQVAGVEPFYDLIVGHIRSSRYLEEGYPGGAGDAHRLVGDQGHLHPGTFCRSEEDILDHYGTGVGIDPYFHCSLPGSGCELMYCSGPARSVGKNLRFVSGWVS